MVAPFVFLRAKVRPTGRGAIGVQGIDTEDGKDEVIGMICVDKEDSSKTILVVSEKGYGKRTPLVTDGEDVYRITNRGGKGVKTINVTEKTGNLVAILNVSEKEDLIITCKSGITLRTPVINIKEAGRNTQGVILIRIDNGDEIAAVSHIEDEEIIVQETEDAEITENEIQAADIVETTDIATENGNGATNEFNNDNDINNFSEPSENLNKNKAI